MEQRAIEDEIDREEMEEYEKKKQNISTETLYGQEMTDKKERENKT